MRKYKVFISAVQKELRMERRAVKEFILGDFLLSEYFDVFLFEDTPARSRSAKTTYLEEVHKSDIYIGILGNKYGSVDKNKLSPTEAEFREAKTKHKNILIYIKGANNADCNRDAGVQKLIADIRDPKVGYSYRRFNGNRELTDLIYESLIAFLKEKGEIGRAVFDQRICDRAKFSDINETKVKWFLKVARDKRNFPLDITASTYEVFTHLKLLNDGKPTNAAILLFGKDPSKFFNQTKIKCIHIPSTTIEKPFASYHIYEEENLFDQVDKAVNFVLDAIRFPVIQQSHTVQVDRPREIPVFVIHEAIVNAAAHRDYNTTSSIQVMVFLDRVEIWNSGTLPAHLKIADLKKPHASHPTNPILASVMYFADYVQQAGSGTLEMVKQCKTHGLPEPEFISEHNLEFKAIISRDIFTTAILDQMELNDRQLNAIKYLKRFGKVSNKAYQEINKTTKRTASRDLAQLVSLKILQKSGITGKGTVYILR